MQNKKILISVSFILIIFLVVLFIYTRNVWNKLEIFSLRHPTIPIDQDDDILFYKDGFAISGDETSFFDFNGNITTCPFTLDGEVLEDLKIDAISVNYMLVDGHSLYKLIYPDIEELFTIDSSIVKMEVHKDLILLLLEDKDGFLQLNYYDPHSGNFSDLGLDNDLAYMDFNYNSYISSLSLLALDINAPFPSSKVLNYDDEFLLFGVVSSIDEVYYRIFRSPTKIILVGTNRIVCYNIGGDIEWDLESNNISNFKTIVKDSGFLIYFDNIIKEDQESEAFNTMFFNRQGDLIKAKLPSQLTGIIPYYGDKLLANQNGKKLLIIDKDLKVEGEFSIDGIDDIYWNNNSIDNLYIKKQDGTLEIYSTKQEDSSK